MIKTGAGFVASAVAAALIASPARAGDGVSEINQTCATQTGCFAGDAPGFPVEIASPGSYVLTGSLSAGPNLDGIALGADGVTLALNGFEIVGPANCIGAGSTVVCDTGDGYGVAGNNRSRITLRNGTIRGFAFGGVILGDRSRIEALVVEGNGGDGIFVGSHSRVHGTSVFQNQGAGVQTRSNVVVTENAVGSNRSNGIDTNVACSVVDNVTFRNGRAGISAVSGATIRGNTAFDNESEGIVAGAGSLVTDNAVRDNDGDGILADNGSSVQQNAVHLNGGFGLNLATEASYHANSITDNTAGTVTGGVIRGHNHCDGANAPNCP